ncbi:tripartite tricarboxylate transporter substrate-binding protein [Cupriavidus necator]|uniref:tripartite tricarboxylate transporter substrate-binding protein n=1 Tax=Cupriavidus necator TaxID=106590 RepID=UPI003B8A8240
MLAVTNEKRLASMPEVPTVGETLRGFGATPWYGLFAPAGTPPAVVSRLQGTPGMSTVSVRRPAVRGANS